MLVPLNVFVFQCAGLFSFSVDMFFLELSGGPSRRFASFLSAQQR